MRRLLLLAGVLAAGLGSYDTRAQRYTVLLTEGGRSGPVGVVKLDGSKRLSVLLAPHARARWLHKLVDEGNAEAVMRLDAAPLPGSPRFADTSATVPRDDPRFLEGLRLYLRRYHDVTLRD